MDLGLRERVCVVTGSTGGIGRATAQLLAAEGARVVTCGRNAALGIGEAHHVAPTSGDRASPSAVDAEAGAVDVLVNNVGLAASALRRGRRRGVGRASGS